MRPVPQSDFWDERFYRQGFRNAEDDIVVEGIGYAIRHAGNIKDSGHYATGYRTAVDLFIERAMSN